MKTKALLLFTWLFLTANVQAQIVTFKTKRITSQVSQHSENDSLVSPSQSQSPTYTSQYKFLSGGNIDYLDGGLIQTNAQLFKINIGNPDGFYTPFYVCVGANTETTTNEDDPNKTTSAAILSPNGGYLNMGFHGNYSPSKWQLKDYTKFSIVYQLGLKSITGDDALTNEKVNMLSGIGNIGLLFQTQAWDPNNPSNLGLAYLQVVFANTLNNKEKIRQIYGNEVDQYFYGINVEAGVEITNYINLRLGYYRYFNNKDINEDFKNGIFKVSLDFVN